MDRQSLSLHITNEFEAYLRCGIPAYGFRRMACEGCDQEKVVAFSCKKRGWCPSCCAKRQTDAADYLVDDVLPLVPYRQMVLSFPIPLRYWMQASRKLFAKVHCVVIHEMRRHYESKAKLAGIKSPKSGCVSFTQRAGSAMTDAEVASLAESISKKVLAVLVRAGLLDNAGKTAFGPNAGRHVTKVGSGFGYYEETPLAKGRLCYSVNRFSLHCNTAVNTHSRDSLRKLVEYMARGPLSNERLELSE